MSSVDCSISKIDSKIKEFFDIHEILDITSPRVVSFLNPFSYNKILSSSKADAIIDSVDDFYCDGVSLCFIYNIFTQRKTRRFSFDYSSVARDFFLNLSLNNQRLAVVGAKSDEIELFSEHLSIEYPELNLVYYRDGYFSSEEEREFVISSLASSEADVILVGMGTPYQEIFCADVKDKLKTNKLLISCGGFLTQTSMQSDYYHPLIKLTGLRWVQRALLHSYVRERLLKDYPLFFLRYVRKYIFKR